MTTIQDTKFADVERLAHHAGMQLWDRPNPTRSGRFCIVRGRDISCTTLMTSTTLPAGSPAGFGTFTKTQEATWPEI